MSTKRFGGLIPPVCTPLSEDGDVDRESLKSLLDHLIENGADGVFVLGSTSEVVYLTASQRQVVLETTVDHVDGRVPVVAGVIEPTTGPVIEQGLIAQQIGVDAVVATAPFYTRTHDLEVEHHFRLIRERVDLPLFAYDIPVAVNSKLSADVVGSLAEEQVLYGVKDSSGDMTSLRNLVRIREHRAPQFVVLTGSEVLVDVAYWLGADGVVPGLGNVDPAGYSELRVAAIEGRWGDARRHQERLIRLFQIVEAGSVERMGRSSSALGAFKTALALLGIIESPRTAEPQIQLNGAEANYVRDRLRDAQLV